MNISVFFNRKNFRRKRLSLRVIARQLHALYCGIKNLIHFTGMFVKLFVKTIQISSLTVLELIILEMMFNEGELNNTRIPKFKVLDII